MPRQPWRTPAVLRRGIRTLTGTADAKGLLAPAGLGVLLALTAYACSNANTQTETASAPAFSPAKEYDVRWTVFAEGLPAGAKEAKLWISLPQELPEQRVQSLAVEGEWRYEFVTDPDFGNRIALVTIPNPSEDVAVTLTGNVQRAAVDAPRSATLTPAERDLYLRQEALVSLSPRLRALADSVGKDSRAQYEFVLGRMDYDKTVPGWGAGDSERACDVGKGNCTDFHSLFLSLSRAEGTPGYFEMGYSTVPEGESDKEGGYHCWAWFYDGTAWIPVDISEADKHPEKAEYFFGNLDADRITFSRGRDVRLPGMQGKPLNYLPSGGYLEVDGRPFEGVKRRITYTVSLPTKPVS